MNVWQFWVKVPDHSETVSPKKGIPPCIITVQDMFLTVAPVRDGIGSHRASSQHRHRFRNMSAAVMLTWFTMYRPKQMVADKVSRYTCSGYPVYIVTVVSTPLYNAHVDYSLTGKWEVIAAWPVLYWLRTKTTMSLPKLVISLSF